MFRETGLLVDTYMFNAENDSQCQLCDIYCSKTTAHVFIHCPVYSELQNNFWQMLRNIAPINMYVDLEKIPLDNKMSFILSCMNNSFTQEWIPIYPIILDFITVIYRTRHAMAKDRGHLWMTHLLDYNDQMM